MATVFDHAEIFREQLEQAGLAFNLPRGLAPIAPKFNDGAVYHCAWAAEAPRLEIRFHIVSLQRPAPPEGFTSITAIDMNTLHEMHLQALIHNVAGHLLSGPNPLPAEAVFPEFGADRGSVSRLGLAPSIFGEGFHECLLLALHKDDVADAYVFFMFESFDQAAELIQNSFYTLTFAQRT